MSNFRVLYTRCLRQQFEDKRYSFLDTGFSKKCYFENPRDIRLTKDISEQEVIIGIPAEDFVGGKVSFAEVAPGVWETRAVVLMRGMFEVPLSSE